MNNYSLEKLINEKKNVFFPECLLFILNIHQDLQDLGE